LTEWKRDQIVFSELIATHDIIVITETHLVGDSSIKGMIPQGSLLFTVNGTGRKGGVALWVNQRLAGHIVLLGKSQTPRGMDSIWVRIQGRALALQGRNIVVGACYAAPAGSSVYSQNTRVQAGARSTGSERVFGRLKALIQRFQGPSDELVLMGDMNARVAQLRELPDAQADEELENAAQVMIGQSMHGIPERRSKDKQANPFGRALMGVCRELELVVLNGRVRGDETGDFTFSQKSGKGRSMIDLYVATPGLFRKAVELRVRNIPVAIGERVGELISDHCPVSLALAVTKGAAGSKKRGGARGKARFDTNRKGRYTSRFADDEAAEIRSVREAVEKLRDVGSTEVVTAVGQVLMGAIEKAFGVTRTRERKVREQTDAPWWTDDCSSARAAMLQQKADMREQGLLEDEVAKQEFSRLRTYYQRLLKEARERYRIAQFEAFLGECKADPRALWKRLNGGKDTACPLTDVCDWTTFFEALFNGECNASNMVDAESILAFINGKERGADGRGWATNGGERAARVVAAAALNLPFTLDEVKRAIRSLRNNKSGGLDKVPAECYKYATREVDNKEVNVLAPHLLTLFEHIRVTGDYPKQFCVSSLTPIHKKGDVRDMGNYRGLAVGGALAKCYAFLLENRLNTWGESCNGRSPFQGGFRRRRGTLHNLFVLRHLTDKYKFGAKSATPLFVCQIDFEKAFDKVPRDKLWLRMEERGVHGSMLDALKKAYDSVMMRVQVEGESGTAFDSAQGVKQGCPLSPTLFGFFIEAFADYLSAKDQSMGAFMAVEDCPTIDGKRVPLMLYADDLSLFARTHKRLMRMLAALREFCEAFGMKVNVRKSEVLGFHPSQQWRDYVRVEGNVPVSMRVIDQGLIRLTHVPWVARARYLGLHFGPDTSFESCREELLASGQRAMHALTRKLRRQGLFLPSIGMRCFDSQVRSILSYGAQIWAPDALLKVVGVVPPTQRSEYFEKALEDRMVQLQRGFFRSLAGVQTSPDRLLYKELGQMPLHLHWAELTFRFWNQLVKATGTIYHGAFREEIRCALTDPARYAHCWGVKMMRLLVMGLGYKFRGGGQEDVDYLVDMITGHELDVGALMDTLRSRFDEDWKSSRLETDPRMFVSDGRKPGIKMCRHVRWMGATTHLKGYIPPKEHVSLLRFRLCVWALEVNRPGGRPRADRWCRVCGDRHAVEDEKHVLMECSAYEDLRSELFGASTPETMQEAMAHADQRALARLVHAIRARRTALTGSQV
jgi:exonuclease III